MIVLKSFLSAKRVKPLSCPRHICQVKIILNSTEEVVVEYLFNFFDSLADWRWHVALTVTLRPGREYRRIVQKPLWREIAEIRAKARKATSRPGGQSRASGGANGLTGNASSAEK